MHIKLSRKATTATAETEHVSYALTINLLTITARRTQFTHEVHAVRT